MIHLENVSLEFPALKHRMMKGSAQKKMTGGVLTSNRTGSSSVRALDNISFVLSEGDRLALLGHNGAGKTTLLRVLAGIYPPTQGRIQTAGRVAPLLNLSFGLDIEATGYDNIWIRGLYLGMSRAQIKEKISQIAAFSELGDFLSLPIRTYSSGMKARLAFAISTHVDADILLLDEAVATGDASFFQKARDQLEVIAGSSKIMVLASHSNKVLRELCSLGLLLEHGRLLAFGPIDEVIEIYKGRDRKHVRSPHNETPPKRPTNCIRQTDTAPVSRARRILLINDTGDLSNPGCRAVRKAYKLLFHRYIQDAHISGSLPVNYWIEHFRDIAVPGKQSIQRNLDAFAIPSTDVADIDRIEWERIRRVAMASDPAFMELVEKSELIVVNGEGSIHHNSVRALALLALMRTALQAGKKVVLLNATIQAVSAQLLLRVLPDLSFIHVREEASLRLLGSLGIDAICEPDLAFLAMDEESLPRTRLLETGSHILVTGGVAVTAESMRKIFDAVESVGMRSVYLSIGDGGETELASRICRERNVAMVEAVTLGVKETIGFLKQFPAAVSGRHHINIFLMRAGIPFLPLPSNSWKVEETLRSVEYPVAPIANYSDLIPSLTALLERRDEVAAASARSFTIGRRAIDGLVERIKTCVS